MQTRIQKPKTFVFKRAIFNKIVNSLSSEHVVILYGPRQVGKTFLMHKVQDYLESKKQKTLYISAEVFSVLKKLSVPDVVALKAYLGDVDTVLIDEAQKIPNIGEVLKVLVDYTDYKILVSGSSSLFLSNLTEESLAGRKRTFTLYPLTFGEFASLTTKSHALDSLDSLLTVGGYPKVDLMFLQGKSFADIQVYLTELVNATLYKDLLSVAQIKHPQKIYDLLELLYYNLSGEVSLHKLANGLNIDVKTVERYLDLLSKVFFVKPLRSLAINPKKEIVRSKKYYFVDNGVANVFYGDFSLTKPKEMMGKLWENYVFTQLSALNEYNNLFVRFYFWRQKTNNGKVKEIDFVLKKGSKIFAIEAKYNVAQIAKYVKPPRLFKQLYPKSKYGIITPLNIEQVFKEVKDFFV